MGDVSTADTADRGQGRCKLAFYRVAKPLSGYTFSFVTGKANQGAKHSGSNALGM